MSIRRMGNPAASVSHTEKRKGKKRWFCFNSCTAMVVSAALLFTSVDCIVVRAEKLVDVLSPATEEVNPTVSENTTTSEVSPYLTNDEGAVIISSFKALQLKDSRIEPEERETLEKVCERMPETLTANVTPVSSVEGETKPGEGETPGEGEIKPGEEETPVEGETKPGEEETPGEGETKPGEGETPGESETKPGEGETSGEGETKPEEGETPGEGEMKPGEGEANPDVGEGQSGAGDNGDQGGADSGSSDNGGANEDNGGQNKPDSESGDDDDADIGNGDQGGIDSSNQDSANDVAAAIESGIFAQNGQRWRLLVETGESGAEYAGSESDSADRAASDNIGSEESGNKGDTTDGTGSESSGSEGGSTSGTEGGSDSSGSEGDGTSGTESGSEGDNTGGTESGNDDGGVSDIEEGNTEDMIGGDSTDIPIAVEEENSSGIEDDKETDIPGVENPDTTVPSVDGASPKTVEVEVPVTWECENYDTDELDVYTFVPKWDEKKWFFEESEENKIPTIEVVYHVLTSEVSTEEELTAAFAAGFAKITLQNDIALTKPLRLPADADIELEGGDYKLIRGIVTAEGEEDGSSETFLGIMIDMDGEDYTEDTYGTLTLKNITVDGGTKTDRAGAPAILDRGNLILDEGAVVKDNFNYGTYPEEKDGETILCYGGGIQVYGELTVSPDALVTENFADKFGGGVYLAGGATLYLYADVIVDNIVGEGHGYGADIYAASGSTIYYDPSIDMDREGFHICAGVKLIPMEVMETALEDLTPVDDKREVYISIAEDSGYNDEQVDELKEGLKKLGYTIITSRRTDIDTTDLRDWYVYDHYDTDPLCWGAGTKNAPPQAWLDEYGGDGKRTFYPYNESHVRYVPKPATTIAEWLERSSEYTSGSTSYLTHFKEHIYTWRQNGSPTMMFVGYGHPSYVDFLFYDPDSDGEKVVDFDVDSSKVYTHTLTGSGFLVNTNVDENNLLHGYLVYYVYNGSYENTKAQSVSIYKLDGVDVDMLHEGTWDFKNSIPGSPPVASSLINNTDWATNMSIQIKTTANRIEVRQQPKAESRDIGESTPILALDLTEKSKYSGFGPLVAYTTDNGGHSCSQASSFTYSNLRMYFTNPMHEKQDILKALQEADFTQEGTQKYFINLFGDAKIGDSKIEYNDTADFGQYQEYMAMMQKEGIALITDRKTPFKDYLGEPADLDSNLVELEQGDGLLTVAELIEKIHESISGKTTTDLKDKLTSPSEENGLKPADPKQSVGNIWLKSATGKEQIRKLDKDDFGEDDRVEVQIIDDIAYYFGDQTNLTVRYDILKPGGEEYINLSTVKPPITPVTFAVTNDMKEWPSGLYTVRQTIDNSSIRGYAYFDLELPPQTYLVTVNVKVKKDDEDWIDHGREFKLQPKGGGDLINLPGEVPAGTYDVYDVTGLEAGAVPTEDRNRGSVTVANADHSGAEQEVIIDYYTVTFCDKNENGNGETVYPDDTPLAPQIVLKGQTISRPEQKDEPSKPPYTFAGWVTETGSDYVFGTTIEKPTKIYASWTYPVTVNVIVNKDGEVWKDHGRKFKLQPEGGGNPIELPGEVSTGKYYVYDVSESAEGVNTGVSVMVQNANQPGTEIANQPIVDYYTVTFCDKNEDGNGETVYPDDTSLAPQIVLKGQTISRPEQKDEPVKPPYTFAGWVTENGSDYVFGTTIEKPTKIYASWTYPVAVNVIVNKDGEVWKNHGRKFKLQPEGGGNPIELPGEVSAGKYYVYDVTEPAKSVNTGVPVVVQNANQPGTEIANQPVVNYYTVTFCDKNEDGNGETVYPDDTPLAPQIVLEGQTISKPEQKDEPVKPPYKFAKWVTRDGDAHDFTTPIDDTTKIYASWTYPVVVKMTVRKDNEVWENHGREFMLKPEDGEPLKGVFVSVPTGAYTVYDITGLEEEAPLTEDRNTGRSVEVENADVPNTVKEVTIDYYTVTFYDENSADKKPCESGTEQNPQIILKDKSADRPTFVPTKDQYAFGGWVAASGTEFDFGSKIDRPTEIYANWDKKEEPRYNVTINVWKDGGEWKDAGRTFVLRQVGGDEETVFDLAQVKKGTYHVYDITGDNRFRAADTAVNVKVDDGDTGVTVTVENKDETATVDYYTVTFYDGREAYGADTLQSPTIVLRGKKAAEPSAPDKKGHRFTGWKTENGGSTAFNFDQAIENKTDIYAGWKVVRSVTATEKKPGEKSTPGGGAENAQTVTVLQETSPHAEISRSNSTPASDKTPTRDDEPRTEDTTRIEIYATMAMITGLMYLLFYFAQEGRGMTEREKEAFVAAFIRWAKKGGKFRRYCALVAIFFILVYYHSIGKYLNREINREYLQLLHFSARSEHQEVRQHEQL